MAGRPLTLPWDFSTFSGNEPVTTLSDNYNAIRNIINDSGSGYANYAADTGAVNAYVVTLPSAPAAYSSGMVVFFKPANTNTAASTINVNAVGSISILTSAGNALTGGEIQLNSVTGLIFDGTNFRIFTPYHLFVNGSASAGAQTISVSGAPHMSIVKAVTATGTASVVLSNIAIGQTFFIILQNNSGAGQNYGIQASGGSHAFFTLTSAGGTIVSGDFNVAFTAVANNLALRVWGVSTALGVLNMFGILA